MRFNELPELAALTDNDLVAGWDTETGTTRKVKASTIKTYISGSVLQQKQLTYSANGDDNGLLYWLGSGGKTQPWSNPALDGKILFFANAFTDGSQLCSILSDRQLNNPGFVSANVPNSWFAWDLGINQKIQFSGYSLRHRNSISFPGNYIRSWKLQGANNLPCNSVEGVANTDWSDIDIKSNDTTINEEGGWGYFPVVSSNNYRFCRIIQTGLTSSGINALVMGEIEIYGTLTRG